MKIIFLGLFIMLLLREIGIASHPSRFSCPVHHKSKVNLNRNCTMKKYNFITLIHLYFLLSEKLYFTAGKII